MHTGTSDSRENDEPLGVCRTGDGAARILARIRANGICANQIRVTQFACRVERASVEDIDLDPPVLATPLGGRVVGDRTRRPQSFSAQAPFVHTALDNRLAHRLGALER
jgi:hypothetical protein